MVVAILFNVEVFAFWGNLLTFKLCLGKGQAFLETLLFLPWASPNKKGKCMQKWR